MGCGGCFKSKSDKAAVFDRRPKVTARIGVSARRLDTHPVIVFVFGGPGSRKGMIVDSMVSSFGFVHVNISEILNKELERFRPSTLQSRRGDTASKDLKAMLDSQAERFSMYWLTNTLTSQVQQDLDATYLIDIIPNLKSMMRARYLTEECNYIMAEFHTKYPISFALNLAVPSDRLVQAKDMYSNSSMQETGGRGDEADASKLERRATLYDQITRNLLGYFDANGMLVTVDVTGGLTGVIWQKVRQLLCELEFRPLHSVGTVVLFEFDPVDWSNFDLEKYAMELVPLEAVVVGGGGSLEGGLETQLRVLSRYIDSRANYADAFVVRSEGSRLPSKTSISTQSLISVSKKPALMFTDIGEDYLENYLQGRPKDYVPSEGGRKYKSISSMDNEVYLFPLDSSDTFCRYIANVMAACRAQDAEA